MWCGDKWYPLLPCPVCGAEEDEEVTDPRDQSIRDVILYDSRHGSSNMVICFYCADYAVTDSSLENAISKWNNMEVCDGRLS